ncbi:hypothetical protein Bbelb_306980 [Branchiostoma belcheri]|nr:hypothetical protein Bbelb_306980 [Branchiostoma belcheri]
MSSSPGSLGPLLRGRSPHGPTKTAWTTRCDHLGPRGDLIGRTRSRRRKPEHKASRPTSAARDIGNVPPVPEPKVSTPSRQAKRSFMWGDLAVREEHQEDQTDVTLDDFSSESEDEDIPKEDITKVTTPPRDFTDDQCVAVDEKVEEPHRGETKETVSVEPKVEKSPLQKLKRQPSCDSLFGGKQVKPGAVWRPYGPPLYGYGSSLNPPPRKRPDTLLILAAIFYCLAVLTAVVFAVLFKTNVIPVYKTPEPVPVWMQQFSPEMQRWYQLALQAAGGDTSAILPPGYVPQPTVPPLVEEFCGNTSLPLLRYGDFNCTSIAYYNIHVRMCIAKCDVGYQTDDAGLLFCNRGRWAPIAPDVVSTLVGVGRAADTMPNTDPGWFEPLGISDQIYADAARGILVKINAPHLPIVETYLDIISEDNIIDFDMMRQLLEWIGPILEDIVAHLDFLQLLSRLETFGATKHPECRLVDCGGESENLADGKLSSNSTTYLSEARVVCERGYLPRHPLLTCNATGHWDKPAQCDPVTCSPPEDPPHGSYLCQGHVFSDRCDVICDVGYLPETDHALGCSWTGNWTAFRRGNTTEMENAVSAGGERYTSIVHIRGMVNASIDVVIPQTLTCVIADCGSISIPAHGDVTCTGTTYGETCHLTCQKGYERLGQDNFTCECYQLWSGEPECIPVSCGSPPEFPNTALQCASGHSYGNTCGVTCADGYEGTNHRSVVCHSSGNWSLQEGALQPVVGGPDLFCQKKDCGNLTSPANGSLTCSGTRYQDSCRLTCEPGYKVGNEQDLHLHSLHSFTCMATGQWNDKPRCVPSDYCRLGLHDCHPEHGICDLTGHQTFSCRCRVGTVGDGRRCERTHCPPFPVAKPENGYFGCSIPASPAADFCQSPDSTAAEYEVVCLLHCNPGYDRLIYAEYSCGHDGNWTIPFDINTNGTIPCLAVKCPNISSPLHGTMTSCDSGYYFRYPEVCNFACDWGYELTTHTSRVRRCQTDATWSGNDAVCIGVKCPDLSAPTNGAMSCNPSSLRYPDSTCTFSCNNGYELATERERHCQADATWSGHNTRCIGVRCPALSAPANGVMTCDSGSSFRHPETYSFTCNDGYQLYTGSSSRTCQANGAWTGSSPSCRACNGGADIIFSIDVSGSVSGHFGTVRNFISGVVRSLSIGGSYARVGLIKFEGSSANRAISLTDYSNKPALLAMIGSLGTSFSSGVPSAAGLSVMRNEFHTSGRPAVRKYGIVLTDGRDSSDSDAVIPYAEALRNDGTTVFCVGVADVLRQTLDNMASRPVRYHVFTASFENLQTIVDELRPRISSCPSGYESHQYSRSCYKAFNQESGYNNAKATCTSDGGTLAMPRDAVTNTFLINLKNTVDQNADFIFGLTDIHQEGRWVWEDDTALGNFSPWGPGQPNNRNNKDCVEYVSANYVDASFRNKWNYITSRRDWKGVTDHLNHPVPETVCPSGYTYHQASRLCFKAYNLERDYSNARATCSSDGGTLAMPRDAVTNNFLIDLKNAVDKNAFFRFGLTDIQQEGRWVWEDGAAVGVFKSWGSGQPDNRACPSGYTYHQASRLCYKAFHQESDYDSARATCTSDGGTLAMPRDAATNTFLINLKNAVDEDGFFYFGMTDIQQEGRWVWEDGTALGSFSSWGIRQPSDSWGTQDCGEYTSAKWWETVARNKWNDIACSYNRKFICQLQYRRKAPACPSGYTYRQTNRLCYKAFNRLSNYNDAKATCSSYGGTLAMPRNAATDNFLINLKNAVDRNTAFFFGLTRIRQEARWEWEDGADLGGFHPWGPREPSDSGGNQDCVEYVSATWYEAALRDTWNDMACSTPRKFICQVPPT